MEQPPKGRRHGKEESLESTRVESRDGHAAREEAEDGQHDLGRYRDLSEIGRGGMGTIFEGLDPRLERLVAVKVLERREPRRILRFFREAGILRQRSLSDDRTQSEIFELPPGSSAAFNVAADATRVELRIIHRWTGGISDPAVLGEDVGREIVFAARTGTQHRFAGMPETD